MRDAVAVLRRTNGRRADIQGLRGLAVILVVLFHSGLSTPGGFVGVDVFFVISGFVITRLLWGELRSTGRLDLPAFYARRVRRLLPALAVLLTTVAAGTHNRDGQGSVTLGNGGTLLVKEIAHVGRGPQRRLLRVIRKGIKQRLDSVEQFTKGNRPELAAKEQVEMEILKAYMPPELTDEEIESGVREIVASTGAQSKKDMGKVMKEATTRYKGRVEGKKIQEIVSRLLP